MKFPFFVAWRYFFSKKDVGIVHIISLISLIGISVSSMALLVVLSVFNGFTGVADKMLSFSYPDISIESRKGKTFSTNETDLNRLRAIEGVKHCKKVVKESVLMNCGERQTIVELWGVEKNYPRSSGMDTAMQIGDFDLGTAEEPKAVLGYALTIETGLGRGAEKMRPFLKFCSPKSNMGSSFIPEENLNMQVAEYAGSFMTDGDMDRKAVFVPLKFAQDLLEYGNDEVTSLNITTDGRKKTDKVKKEIEKSVNRDLVVKNRFEQDPLYYKVVKAERLAVYLILGFIVFIASFNVMGSVSLFAMVKRNDIRILSSMGTSTENIRKIFFIVGMVLSACGCIAGLSIGSLFCFIQQQFGLIKIGTTGFVVDSFPVELRAFDIMSVFLLVMAIASLCVGVMVRRIKIVTDK